MVTKPLEQISAEDCWELLSGQSVGRLAVAITNHPDIFPVNYKVSDGQIVIRTAEGQKLAAAVLGSAVAFEVDTLDPKTATGWSVVVKGAASEPRSLDDYLEAEDLEIEPWADGAKLRYILITPSSVTGRRIPNR